LNKKKIAVVTGTRAEYGILRYVIKYLKESNFLDLHLIVTGMHLSHEFGNTYKEIENDGILINDKVEILLSGDSPTSISKSIALGIISFSEIFERIKPNILLVLGDRFEIISASIAATVSKIPIAHIHGGESTEGVIDEPFRHSITKMSHLHFTCSEIYKERVIQLGENPNYVYNFGSPAIDNIYNLKLIDKKEIEKLINFEISDKCFVITFHPVTLENSSAENQFSELLLGLKKFKNYKLIFTYPNADTEGRIIIKMIEEFIRNNPYQSISFKSLGQIKYFSILKYSTLVIGNSSSGLIEVPSFRIPTINIGDRQKGRIKAKSVIDCLPNKESIEQAINKGISKHFQEGLKELKNPYGEKGSSKKIVKQLENVNIDKDFLKKKFYNL
jgi:GDP/UDP-N,N'-diacetylbacillosamine 2-epimerase (hydrolysing)